MKKYLLFLLTSALIFIFYCSTPPPANQQTTSQYKASISQDLEKIGEIDIPFRSPHLYIDKYHIYIWDKFRCTVHTFSHEPLQLINTFGTRGEGPSELLYIGNFNIANNHIYLSSTNKITCFSKDGTFINELKSSVQIYSLFPFEEKFIGKKYYYSGPGKKHDKTSYELFDHNLKFQKTISLIDHMREVEDENVEKINILWFNDCTRGVVYKNRFYLASTSKGYYIATFDKNGDLLYEIKKNFQPVPITAKFKNTLFKQINQSKMESFKKFYQNRKIIFPNYFPAFVSFTIDNDMIYVFLYPDEEFKYMDVEILDLKGKLIRKSKIAATFWHEFQEDNIMVYHDSVYFMDINETGENLAIYRYLLKP